MTISDFLFPQTCLSCFSLDVEKDYTFCSQCWKDLIYIRDPLCSICGLPFEFCFAEEDINKDHKLCGSCYKKAPFYDSARSLFSYNDVVKKMILRFKNGDQTQYAKYFSHIIFSNYKNYFEAVDYIIPVPLHKKRLFFRNFNQAALLANHYGNLSKKPVLHNVLYRGVNNPSQEKKTRKERFENVVNVFCVQNAHSVKDKNILLVDDVMTTGATLDSCAKTLKDAGVRKVNCISIARSVNASV